MKTRFLACLSIICILMTNNMAVSQITQRIRIMQKPTSLYIPRAGLNIQSLGSKSSQTTWYIFSDRDNNKTYRSYSSSETFQTLRYMEEYYVVDTVGDFLHIYSGPSGIEDTILPANAKDYGWVRRESALLWDYSIRNEYGITRKAMIHNKEESVEAALRGEDVNLVSFYKDPQLQIKTNKTAQLYQIFFIYKYYPEDADEKGAKSVLLGTSYKLVPGADPSENIYGWVNYNRVIPWDHRVCCIPNPDDKAISERMQSGFKAAVFSDVITAQNYAKKMPVDDSDIYLNSDSFSKKIDGNIPRFPVLWPSKKIIENNGVMRIGIMGEVQSNKNSITAEKSNEITSGIFQRLSDLDHINLVFVIDGTYSMGEYYKKVAEALINSMRTLKGSGTTQFKFAAVVYRDMDEGPLYQVKERTDNVEDMATFLRTVKTSPSPIGDDAEAVNFGIRKAIFSAASSPSEMNFLILIGDAGNHDRKDDSQISKDEVIDLLYKSRYNFLAFQVHRFPKTAYGDFISQSNWIMQKVADRYYADELEAAKKAHQTPFPAPAAKPDGAKRRWIIQTPYCYSSVNYVMPDQPVLNPDILKSQIEMAIKSLHDTLGYFNKAMNKTLNLGQPITTSIADVNKEMLAKNKITEYQNILGPGIKSMLFTYNKNLPPDAWEILSQKRFQMYTKGYTPLKIYGQTENLWQLNLFLTDEELRDIQYQMRKLVDANNKMDRRKACKEAWKELLKDHTGNLTEEELNKMTIGEMEKLIFGLPGNSSFLNLKLEDIDDEAKFTVDDMRIWKNIVNTKLDMITKIVGNSNDLWKDYSFLPNNSQRYFYLPQDFLP